MKVKLIWEFRGVDSAGMAKHHATHLNEFAKRENLADFESGVETPHSYFSMAYLTLPKEGSENIVRVLRPYKIMEE